MGRSDRRFSSVWVKSVDQSESESLTAFLQSILSDRVSDSTVRKSTFGGICLALTISIAIAFGLNRANAAEEDATSFSGIYGAVLPAERGDVGYRKEGSIAKILVKPGDTVEANQIVVEMDARELNARLALAEQEFNKATAIMNDESAVNTAKAQFAKVDATFSTNQKLQQKSELEIFRLQMDRNEKQASLDFATAKHAQDVIEVSIKKEQLNMAKLDLEMAKARSPVAGIVSEQLHYPGESVRPGEPILKIIQMNELLFRIELDIMKIPPHKIADYQIDVRFELSPGESFSFTDIQLDRSVPNNVDSQNYFAFALLKNTMVEDRNGTLHWRLRPGMAGEVTFKKVD